MPQPQRPLDLGVVLDRLADRCDVAVDALLVTVPVAGESQTQAIVDGYLDQVLDTLRMVAAIGRETRACLGEVPPALPAEPARAGGWSGPAQWSR